MKIVNISKPYILCLLWYMTFLIRYLTNLNLTFSSIMWVLAGMSIYLYCFICYKDMHVISSCSLLLVVAAGIGMFYSQNKNLSTALVLLTSQSVGILLYKNKWILKTINILGIVVIIYLLFAVLNIRLNGESGDFYLAQLTGQNTVSIILVHFLAINLLYHSYFKLRINYTIYIISLIITILCKGNGGILSVCTILGCILLLSSKKQTISIPKTLLIVTAMCILVFSFGYMDDIWEFVTDDNSRIAIWKLYGRLMIARPLNLIFGAPISSSKVLLHYKNMHNTFINFHYMYGMIPFLVYSFCILQIGYKAFINKEYMTLIAWGAIIIRAMVDSTDFCYMSLWMFWFCDLWISKINEKKEKRKKGVQFRLFYK